MSEKHEEDVRKILASGLRFRKVEASYLLDLATRADDTGLVEEKSERNKELMEDWEREEYRDEFRRLAILEMTVPGLVRFISLRRFFGWVEYDKSWMQCTATTRAGKRCKNRSDYCDGPLWFVEGKTDRCHLHQESAPPNPPDGKVLPFPNPIKDRS